MGIINYIEFGGVKSSDYGIYVSGEGTFNAPERDVELIEIPGRNGDFSLDKGRFKNITVTYPVFNYETNLADFRTRLSDFRNALKSKIGYQRLEDTFHPDEYRMATFIDVFEVQPVMYNTASTIELTFNCKPQRFLKSGEIPQTIGQWGETETAEGEIATFNAEPNTGIKSLVANIVPKQEGSGDPSPTNVRPISGWDTVGIKQRGKNLLKVNEYANVRQYGLYNYALGDSSISFNQLPPGQHWPNLWIAFDNVPTGTPVTFSGTYTNPNLGATPNIALGYVDPNDANFNTYTDIIKKVISTTGSGTFSLTGMIPDGKLCALKMTPTNSSDVSMVTQVFKVEEMQIELGSTATAYEPYEGESKSIPLGQTVYGGALDVVSGKLTITKGFTTFNGSESWTASSGREGFYVPLNALLKVANYIGKIISNSLATYSNHQGADYLESTNGITAFGKTSYPNQNWIYAKANGITTANDFKTWLASNPLQICYELATPTEIQLTPTEVKTLLGNNNIWADSGEVSVEYGAVPNDVYNPTPFEAHPLIEAHGYGAINMNGRNITLAQGQPVGDVVLWNGAISSSNSLVEIPLKPALFGSGDTFYLSAAMGFNANLPNESFNNSTQGSATSSSADVIVNNGSFVFGSSSMAFDVLANDIEFVAGTAKQVDVTFTINTTSPTRLFYAYLHINYEPDENQIRILSTAGSANKLSVEGSAKGFSTYIPDTATYIDCEIGEAYYLEDGEVISANNSVSLPAILPELKAGNNPITHDDTITELKITPRWWKI